MFARDNYLYLSLQQRAGTTLGLNIITDSAAHQGPVVSSVIAGGSGDVASVQKGDVIKDVNGISMIDKPHDDVLAALRRSSGTVRMVVLRRQNINTGVPLSQEGGSTITDDVKWAASSKAHTEAHASSTLERGSDGEDTANRRATVYDTPAAVPKSVSVLARLRGNSSSVPYTFAVTEMNKTVRLLFFGGVFFPLHICAVQACLLQCQYSHGWPLLSHSCVT